MASPAHGPGLSSMFDAVEMMRKTWSGMNVPSSLQPTMDLEEIDRRIADLRVVEQWLQLNQSMLQTTIQTLEIQRNTLAAFQAFSQAGAMVTHPAAAPAAKSSSAPPPPRAFSANQPTRAAQNPGPVGPGDQPTGTPPDNPSGNPLGNPLGNPSGNAMGGASIAAAQAALWWDFLQQPFRQMTEAANRQAASAPEPDSSDPPSAAATHGLRGGHAQSELRTGSAPIAATASGPTSGMDPHRQAGRSPGPPALNPGKHAASQAGDASASPSRRIPRS